MKRLRNLIVVSALLLVPHTTLAQGLGGGGSPPNTWSVSYEYQGLDVETGAIIDANGKHAYTDCNDWAVWGGGRGMASNVSDGTNTVYECSVVSLGTITVVVTWNGPDPVPNNLFVGLHGQAVSQAAGSGDTGAADDGLRHPDVLWLTSGGLVRESSSQGFRYLYFANPQPVVRIPVQMSSYAYSHDTSGTASTSCGVSATASSRAVRVSSDRDVTYRRDVGTDAATGWVTGIRVPNERDPLGVMYGDIEVGLNWDDVALAWRYSGSVQYSRSLFGPWAGPHGVFNEWQTTNPNNYICDGPFSENEWIPVAWNWLLPTIGSPGQYVNGTAEQTVHYAATDDVDGFQADNWYVMRLHGPTKKEEKYTGDYQGWLTKPESPVHRDGFRLATENYSGPPPEPCIVTLTVQSGTTYMDGWEYSGELSATMAKLLDVHFGVRRSLNTTDTFAVNRTLQVSVGDGMKASWWCVPAGVVEQWNESRWGDAGYLGDQHVAVLTDLHFEGRLKILPISDPDLEP